MSRTILAVTIVTGLLLAPVTEATLVRYDYVGPDFDTPSPLDLPYEAGDHVEGFITIDDSYLDPLGGAYLNAGHVTGLEPWLTDLSFTDGIKTIDIADFPSLDQWNVSIRIDANDMVAWQITLQLSTATPLSSISTHCGEALASNPFMWCPPDGLKQLKDIAYEPTSETTSVLASIATFDGNAEVLWSSTVVPLPAAIWLFGSGLIGLVGIARSRRKV